MNYPHGKIARRRALWLPMLWSLLLLVGAQIARASTVTFTTNTTIDTNTATYEGYDVIVHGCTVTINGAHSFQSLTVESNGIVTHAQGLVGGMNLTIPGNVTINNGSSINMNGKGYAGGQGAGKGDADNSSNNGGGGGSYGGEARSGGTASGGAVYGSIKNPTDLGSGGGSGYAGAYSGYNGGGSVTLIVSGTLQVDGILSVNGAGGGSNYGGGGSGGSINLNVSTLTGTGAITAGGAGYVGGRAGSGGGGRIAIYYTTKTYSGALNAAGGQCDYGIAGAGTIFQQQAGQAQGDLLVDNNSNSGLGTPISGAQTFDNVLVRKAGVLTPLYQQILDVTVLNNCTVESGGYISANGRGYGPGQGPGHGGNDNSGNNGGAGGTYGGAGRNAPAAVAGVEYGDIRNPSDFGSGGGTGYNGAYSGYAGGGSIRLTVNGVLQVDGVLSANGAGNGTNYGSGGSGGGITLRVGSLAGAGSVTADGAGYIGGRGGSGGGGRIAIYFDQNTFTGGLRAAGGQCDYGWAAAGTIFRQQSGQTLGDLWIQNNGNAGLPTILVQAQTFDNVIVSDQAILSPPVMTTLRLTTLGNFTIKSGGSVSSVGRGYPAGQGPGVGGYDSINNRGAGAGYGGKGRSSNNAAGGKVYGSEALPTDFGSGGAIVSGIYGWAGGGAIYLTINGTLQVDGALSANGDGGGNNYGGGGSGGSLLIRAGMIAGNGGITADGAGYIGSSGGSGGGGRIALYYVKNNFVGNLTANGGRCDFGYADNGTIHQEVTTGNLTVTLSLSSTTVGSGQITYISVNLSGAAPAGGIDVQLTSSNPLTATVPPTVTIPEGQTSAVVSIVTNAVTQAQTTDLQAQLWDQASTQTLTVKPFLGTLILNPASANGNSTVSGTLTLNTPAPAGGLSVALTSSINVSVPPLLTFAGGTTTRSFTVSVGTIATAGTATINAFTGQEKLTATLFVNPSGITLAALSVAPASVIGGSSSAGVVVLSKAAPAGGVTVALSSGDPTVGVPASVVVAAGKTSASFPISTQVVASPKSALISATLGVTKMATLNVRLPGVSSLILIPSSVTGGDTSIGIVTLEAPSAAPVVVTITSSKTQAVPDAILVIPAGETTGAFSIATSSVASTVTATVTAKANNIAKSQTLTISP